MPEVGQHTPISDEEAEEWVRRMVTGAEDLDMIYESEDWNMFVEAKFGLERGYGPYDTQTEVLGRGRGELYGRLWEAGFKVSTFEIRGVETKRIIDELGVFRSWDYAQRHLIPF